MSELKCPNCQSKRLRKAGFLYDQYGKNQRYECRDCRKHTIRPVVDVVINTTS
jgi:transposase-like protein